MKKRNCCLPIDEQNAQCIGKFSSKSTMLRVLSNVNQSECVNLERENDFAFVMNNGKRRIPVCVSVDQVYEMVAKSNWVKTSVMNMDLKDVIVDMALSKIDKHDEYMCQRVLDDYDLYNYGFVEGALTDDAFRWLASEIVANGWGDSDETMDIIEKFIAKLYHSKVGVYSGQRMIPVIYLDDSWEPYRVGDDLMWPLSTLKILYDPFGGEARSEAPWVLNAKKCVDRYRPFLVEVEDIAIENFETVVGEAEENISMRLSDKDFGRLQRGLEKSLRYREDKKTHNCK